MSSKVFFSHSFIFVPGVQWDLIQPVHQSPAFPIQDENSEEDSPLETSSDYYPSHSSGDTEKPQPSDEKVKMREFIYLRRRSM